MRPRPAVTGLDFSTPGGLAQLRRLRRKLIEDCACRVRLLAHPLCGTGPQSTPCRCGKSAHWCGTICGFAIAGRKAANGGSFRGYLSRNSIVLWNLQVVV
jgi:hypothetical protein